MTLQALQDGTETEQDDPPCCAPAGKLFDRSVTAAYGPGDWLHPAEIASAISRMDNGARRISDPGLQLANYWVRVKVTTPCSLTSCMVTEFGPLNWTLQIPPGGFVVWPPP